MLAVLLFSFNAAALVSTASTKVNLDRAFPAMMGPTKGLILPLELPVGSTELWVTGVKIEMPPQFLCHSRLGLARVEGLDPDSLKMGREENKHNAKYDIEWFMGNSQGNLENQLPAGFGIKLDTKTVRKPVYTVQLQHEHAKAPASADLKVSLQYFRGEEAQKLGLKPLYGDAFSIVENGRRHWNVPAGRHLYKTGVKFYAGGSPTFKLHYIQPHAHAYTDWIELYNITEGRTVWRGKGVTDKKSRSLASIETYSSSEGVELDVAHKYEVRTEYNNTNARPVDAMILLKVYTDRKINSFIDQPFKRKGDKQHAHH